MCGLVGFISFKRPTHPFTTALCNYMQQGMYVGGVRGRDSTGLFTVDRTENATRVIKGAVDGSMFVDQFNVRGVLENIADYNTMIIHHRKATRGSITPSNAHPFKVGPITLVHNGSIYDYNKLGNGNTLSVDSEAIAHALSTHGKKEILEEIDGAFALIWHDERDNTINISRNKERPLALAEIEPHSSLLIASEKEMLRWLATRNNVVITTMLEPKENSLFTWELGNKDVGVRGYRTEEFSPKKRGYAGWPQQQSGTTTANTKASNSSKKNEEDVKEILARYSLCVGDTMEYTATEFFPYATSPGRGVLQGIDICGNFEVINYDLKGVADDFTGARMQGVIVGIKKTKGFPQWVTVMVKGSTVVDKDWRNKDNSLLTKEMDEIEEERKERFNKRVPPKVPICAYNCDVLCHECSVHRKDTMGQTGNLLEYSKNPSPTYVVGPNNIMMLHNDWKECVKGGCELCSADLLEPDDVVWTVNGDPLCEECGEMYDAGSGMYSFL